MLKQTLALNLPQRSSYRRVKPDAGFHMQIASMSDAHRRFCERVVQRDVTPYPISAYNCNSSNAHGGGKKQLLRCLINCNKAINYLFEGHAVFAELNQCIRVRAKIYYTVAELLSHGCHRLARLFLIVRKLSDKTIFFSAVKFQPSS